jgi:cellulase/cellobiase CelA1
MNYYIVTKEVFDTLDPSGIQYAHTSQDESKNIVTTSDTIDSVLNTFNSIPELATYVSNNHIDWTGDGSGIEEWEFEEIEYLSGI